MSKRTKPQKNSKSSITERRLILPIELERRRKRATLSGNGNDDALYNRAPTCAESGCNNEGSYSVPGTYGYYYCGTHKGRAGYGRGDSMG